MEHIMVPLYKHSSNDTAPALAYLMWFVAGPAHPRNENITETVLYVTNSNFWLHPTHTGGCLGVRWVAAISSVYMLLYIRIHKKKYDFRLKRLQYVTNSNF